jgi:hypothetical protein
VRRWGTDGRSTAVRDAGGDECSLPPRNLVAVAAVRGASSSTFGLVSPVLDAQLERRETLRARGWTPRELVVPVCARLGADPALVLSGGRARPEARARAVIAALACDGAGFPGAAAAAVLRVGGPALAAARRSSRRSAGVRAPNARA